MLERREDVHHVEGGHAPGLGDHGGHQAALALAAAHVVVQRAAAGKGERLRAVEAAEAFGERAVRVVAHGALDVRGLLGGELHPRAADGVHQLDDGGEVDAEPAVDVKAEGVFKRSDQRVFIAGADDGIDLLLVSVLIGDEHVAREGDGRNLAAGEVHLNEHHDVAAAVFGDGAVIVHAQNQERFGSLGMEHDDEKKERKQRIGCNAGPFVCCEIIFDAGNGHETILFYVLKYMGNRTNKHSIDRDKNQEGERRTQALEGEKDKKNLHRTRCFVYNKNDMDF